MTAGTIEEEHQMLLLSGCLFLILDALCGLLCIGFGTTHWRLRTDVGELQTPTRERGKV